MTIQTRPTTIIRDRNHASFCVAYGLSPEFLLDTDGIVVAEFQVSPELFEATNAYLHNSPIPVQSFVSACRYVGDRINDLKRNRRCNHGN
jgi:hypothetical protein